MRFHDVLFFKGKKIGQDSGDLVPNFNITKMFKGPTEHVTDHSSACVGVTCKVKN